VPQIPNLMLSLILGNAINLGADASNLLQVLEKQARAELEQENWLSGSDIFAQILSHIDERFGSDDANDPVTSQLRIWITRMDAIVDPSWGNSTLQNSLVRRQQIESLLDLTESQRDILRLRLPPFLEGNIIIAGEHLPWLTKDRKEEHTYYGKSLLDHLIQRGFDAETVAQIDQATDQTLGLVADPLQADVYASRGLVVGYVQSGKTTNINVLIAKAIDAGYRLVVVLAGMTNVLRDQTQRRFDKEVVGKTIVEIDPDEGSGSGYVYQADWNEFIEHPQPMPCNAPKIERLTTKKDDFQTQINTFTSDWVNNGRSARVIILKKNPARIEKLCKELKKLSESDRERLPVLVIDDESDQASVNTVKPTPLAEGEEKKRTTTNKRIVQLLKVLPRAQYIGYTATPFANILIDPDDEADLFPRDFIISLSQPNDYMGVRKFHDLDDDFMPIEDLPAKLSNKAKHVRDIFVEDEGGADIKLLEAIDLYILTGAVKLYRQEQGTSKFRHHTMFYTDSTLKNEHENARVRINALWRQGNYQNQIGMSRLEELFDSDIRVHSNRSSDSKYFPALFSELEKYIHKAIQLIEKPFNSFDRILVVNSDEPDMTPDFEMEQIWKIIVGGAKLSRGYTIEGLTITYFCRNSLAADTLMQMGRWFGYRRGYEDLVRLFISRDQPLSKTGSAKLDLYEAFEDMCRDEEALRGQLRKYTEVRVDGSRVTPRDIPPLIQCSHPKLKPAQKNKMWNAVVQSRNFGGGRFVSARTSLTGENREHNRTTFTGLLTSLANSKEIQLRNDERYPALVFSATKEQLTLVLNLLKWHDEPKHINREQEIRLFLDFLQDPRNGILQWRIVLPLLKSTSNGEWKPTERDSVPIILRGWKDNNTFKTMADPRHREACYAIANIDKVKEPHLLSPDVKQLQAEPGNAVLLLYAVRPTPESEATTFLEPSIPAMGMEFFLPNNSMAAVGITVNSNENPSAASVPIDLVNNT
jgi:hypothetical protein